jgi:hypothetical protein
LNHAGEAGVKLPGAQPAPVDHEGTYRLPRPISTAGSSGPERPRDYSMTISQRTVQEIGGGTAVHSVAQFIDHQINDP